MHELSKALGEEMSSATTYINKDDEESLKGKAKHQGNHVNFFNAKLRKFPLTGVPPPLIDARKTAIIDKNVWPKCMLHTFIKAS